MLRRIGNADIPGEEMTETIATVTEQNHDMVGFQKVPNPMPTRLIAAKLWLLGRNNTARQVLWG
jgi:hypothetical protein